jgi:ADP-heptose:LPS heptosyltransferase
MRHRGFNLLFRAMDGVLDVAVRLTQRPVAPTPVRRLLLTNGAHLGDIVLATAVLPVLKAALPGIRIGMLVGGWSMPVVRNHPMLDRVHRLDHWRHNRSPLPLREKFKVWWRTRQLALKEIREVDYDLAIDLNFLFPNSIALLWQAGIPERIGYTSAGLGPLLTRRLEVAMQGSQRSIIDFHLELLKQIPGIGPLPVELARPSILRANVDVATLAGAGSYVVLHLGSGSVLKDWPEASWQQLARRLVALGHRLVLTGTGLREKEKIERLRQEVVGATDLCDRLTWNEFVEVIASASLLVASDSVAAHIAAAVGTQAVITGHGMTNLHLWRPPSASAKVLMKPVSCAPCYRTGGCTSMECIRGLSSDIVAAEAEEMLRIHPSGPSA